MAGKSLEELMAAGGKAVDEAPAPKGKSLEELMAMGGEAAPEHSPPAQDPRKSDWRDWDLSGADRLAKSFVQGLALNHADEATSAIESAIDDPLHPTKTYAQHQKENEPRYDEATEAHPIVNLAGSLAIPVPGVGELGAAGRVAQAGVQGAVLSGLGAHGASHETGLDAVKGLAVPMLVGGVGGAALHGVGESIGKQANQAYDSVLNAAREPFQEAQAKLAAKAEDALANHYTNSAKAEAKAADDIAQKQVRDVVKAKANKTLAESEAKAVAEKQVTKEQVSQQAEYDAAKGKYDSEVDKIKRKAFEDLVRRHKAALDAPGKSQSRLEALLDEQKGLDSSEKGLVGNMYQSDYEASHLYGDALKGKQDVNPEALKRLQELEGKKALVGERRMLEPAPEERAAAQMALKRQALDARLKELQAQPKLTAGPEQTLADYLKDQELRTSLPSDIVKKAQDAAVQTEGKLRPDFKPPSQPKVATPEETQAAIRKLLNPEEISKLGKARLADRLTRGEPVPTAYPFPTKPIPDADAARAQAQSALSNGPNILHDIGKPELKRALEEAKIPTDPELLSKQPKYGTLGPLKTVGRLVGLMQGHAPTLGSDFGKTQGGLALTKGVGNLMNGVTSSGLPAKVSSVLSQYLRPAPAKPTKEQLIEYLRSKAK